MTTANAGVSVVLPVYNGKRYLQEVLTAVLSQEIDPTRELEVLVVDDGSTDRSAEVVRQYVDTGKVRLLDGGGRGAATALNLGVDAAR